MHKKKVLIFIIAFNDEDQIEKVLKRVPLELLSDYDREILLIVDSSTDKTFEKAHFFQIKNNIPNLKILYNPIAQGYGGNQKLGYEYAVQHGFDAIVLLHGGGQYTPEEMGKLLMPILEDRADAVIGSRFLNGNEARKGGMPLYKYVGNKLLTAIQNKILKTAYTDLHSGYRAYSVKALKEIPFSLNSNSYPFDTQLFIQFLLARKRVIETDIPAFYEKGIHDLNKLVFAWKVIHETLMSRLQNMALFYRREYDLVPFSEEYSLKLGYVSSHTMAIGAVPENSRVLDIGGGQGRIARELKKKGCFVAGIDKNPLVASENYDLFFQRDLDFIDFDFDLQPYDHVLLLDIIEHLAYPEYFLDQLRVRFGLRQPKIIITVPNIGFFINRLQLLIGNFNYGKEGVLDKTHKRLYTFSTIVKNCRQSGYIVEKVKGIPAPFPKAIGNNIVGHILLQINRMLIAVWRGFFSYQIYLEVRPTPVVNALLELSIDESRKRRVTLSNVANEINEFKH